MLAKVEGHYKKKKAKKICIIKKQIFSSLEVQKVSSPVPLVG